MVLDSTTSHSQSRNSDTSHPQLPTAKGTQIQSNQPKLFDLGSKPVTKEERACDAKNLAARRKRSEIRRFKLIAATCDETSEPLSKRLKKIPLNGLKRESKVVCDGAEEQGLDMPMFGTQRRCQPDDASFGCRIGVVTGAVLSMEEGCMDGAGCGQEQIAGEDDGGGHCVVSICGRSREMEDAAVAVPSFLSLPLLSADQGGSVSTKTFHMFGVFDGHGGPQAAEICKDRMSGMLAEEMIAAGDCSRSGWESCMQSCFQRLDGELCGTCPHGSECSHTTSTISSCREPLVPGSVGTTAVVAVVGADDIIVGNCGDSRAVLSRGGQAVPLSFDHKASRPDEVARIEAAGGCVFNWQGHRVCGVLAMSRALGDSYLKPYVSGLPEVTVTARSEEDECLILASDGLWDVLSNEFACSVAQKVFAGWHRQQTNYQHRYPLFGHDAKQHDPQQQQLNCGNGDAEEFPSQVVAALLTKLALAKQSKDNISVVVVDLRRA